MLTVCYRAGASGASDPKKSFRKTYRHSRQCLLEIFIFSFKSFSLLIFSLLNFS